MTKDQTPASGHNSVAPLGDLLERARTGAIALLVSKLDDSSITAAELGVLRNLLRDNGMVLTPEPDTLRKPEDGEAPLPDLPDVPEYLR